MSSEGAQKTVYECLRCGKHMHYEQLTAMPDLKCANCGYRILRKVRPPIVKRVKAR